MTKKKVTEPVTVPDLTIVSYQSAEAGMPPWVAESEEFKYLHPVNGREYTTQISVRGDTQEQALAKAQAQLDTFMADRGNTVFEVIPFTADQLARAKQ